MSEHTLNKEINTYFSLLTPTQKESVLSMIKSFLKTDKRVTRKQYNAELNAAENRIGKAKYMHQDDLEKEAEKW